MFKSSELPYLSLSEDDEGARFAGVGLSLGLGLGLRARGFGAGFSVNEKNTHGPHLHQPKEENEIFTSIHNSSPKFWITLKLVHLILA